MKWYKAGVLAVIILSSCTDNKVYDTFRNTSLSGWEKNDTLLFDVPKIQHKGDYQTNLYLRISQAYPFMKLTLICEQTVYPRMMVYKDTINCDLISRNGIVKGRGISLYDYAFNVTKMPLSPGDSLHITVRHDMKRELLPGISNVGIQLLKE